MTYFNPERHLIAAEFYKRLSGGVDISAKMNRYINMVGSPIEADLLAWLFVQPAYRVATFSESRSLPLGRECQGYIIPQAPLGKFKVDFLVVVGTSSSRFKMFAVECDGHEFHEKTKLQVARDKKRERYLTSIGCSMVRFSGSEIYKDPAGCAMEVLEMVRDAQFRTDAA